ncbi:hypothetical protein Ptr902_10722 [Pyrenophora tritici-repentis]|nr:hypothetical protein Ptr902_10722 [Pyrenophora tritici-repentis]
MVRGPRGPENRCRKSMIPRILAAMSQVETIGNHHLLILGNITSRRPEPALVAGTAAAHSSAAVSGLTTLYHQQQKLCISACDRRSITDGRPHLRMSG